MYTLKLPIYPVSIRMANDMYFYLVKNDNGKVKIKEFKVGVNQSIIKVPFISDYLVVISFSNSGKPHIIVYKLKPNGDRIEAELLDRFDMSNILDALVKYPFVNKLNAFKLFVVPKITV